MPSLVVEPLLFLTEQSAVSKRFAVLFAEDDCVWFYLTHAGACFPERGCWVLNLPSAPAEPDVAAYRATSSLLPAPAAIVDVGGVRAVTRDDPWSFRWSPDGEAVAAYLGDVALAFVVVGVRRGFSRYLRESGEWGNTWDEPLFKQTIPGAS